MPLWITISLSRRAQNGHSCLGRLFVRNACEAAGVKYEFQKFKSGFIVCFYRLEEKVDKKLIKADKKPIKDDRQELIISYVKGHGAISNKEAREILGLADSTTKRLLMEMVDNNVLRMEGERKARKYFIND